MIDISSEGGIVAARRILISLTFAMFCLKASPVLAAPCESLATLKLSHTTITSANTAAAGTFTPPTGGPAAASPFLTLPSFCRVAATLTPSSDSDIKVEVWLPLAGWNGKFQAVGNGGFAGVISYPALAAAVKDGYATAEHRHRPSREHGGICTRSPGETHRLR
jgi:feruloyl esterase